MNITGVNFVKMIQHKLESNPLQQGIIGIQLPGMVSTDIINVVVNELFYNSDIQVVIIPPPLTTVFASGVDKDVKAIGGRVQRDRLDGIRYNRVYIALYWDDLGSLNSVHHDIFFQVEEAGSGAYRVSISDNRDFGGDSVKVVEPETTGDKVVFANKMKTVLSQVDSTTVSDEPVDMLFSRDSIAKRLLGDWWIDFPEHVADKKLMAANVLAYVQDHQVEMHQVINDIRDRYANGNFGPGIIVTYPWFPSAEVTMMQVKSGKYVRIKVGMVHFFFSVDRTDGVNWYDWMLTELNSLASD